MTALPLLAKFIFNARAWQSPLHVGMKPSFRPDYFINRPVEVCDLVPITAAVSNRAAEWVPVGFRRPFVCTIGKR